MTESGRGVQAAYRADESRAGQLLVLRRQGPAPRVLLRAAPPLIFLAITAGIGYTIWSNFGAEILLTIHQVKAGAINPETAIPLAVGAFFCGYFLYAGSTLSFGASDTWGYWRRATWDAEAGQFRGEFVTVPFLWSRRVAVPFASIENVGFAAGPEGFGAVAFEVRLRTAGELPSPQLPLTVENIDSRALALEMFFEIARIVGLSTQHIDRDTPRRLDVNAYRSAAERRLAAGGDDLDDDDDKDDDDDLDDDKDDLDEGDEDSEEDEDDYDYVSQDFAPIPGAPGQAAQLLSPGKVPEYRPDALKEAVHFTRVDFWEPGKAIRLLRPAWPAAACVGVPLAIGMFFGVLACWPGRWLVDLAVLPAVLPWWAIFAATTAFVGAVATWCFLPNMPEQEAVFDRNRDVFRFRSGSRVLERPLAAIRAVTVGGIRTAEPLRGGGFRTRTLTDSRAQIRIAGDDFDEAVFETDLSDQDSNKPFDVLFPLAGALAKELRVPWRVASAPDPERLPLGRGARILTVAALTLSLAWGGWYVTQTRVANLAFATAREEIVRKGGVVTYFDGIGFRNFHTVRDVTKVEFPNGIDDAGLLDLIDDLALIPRLNLILADAPLTDACATPLGTLKNLKMLDLSGTRLSDDGYHELHRLTGIESLNLSATAAGNHGVSGCGMINDLRLLYLNGCRARDSEMANLRIADKLRYVNVAGTQVTAAGAQVLRDALPEVTIEGVPEPGAAP